MVYLKYYSVWFYYLIRLNIAKSIFIILSIISWNFAGTYDEVKNEANIVQEVVVGDQYLYISKEISNDKIKFELLQYDEPQEVKDDKITWYETSNWNIFWWITFIVSSIIVVVTTLHIENDEVGWDISGVRKRALRFFPYTVEENGIYHYIIFGRLVGKRDYQVSRNYLIGEFDINSLRDVLYCPLFTKTSKSGNNSDKTSIK